MPNISVLKETKMTEQVPSLEVIDELEYGVWKATVLEAALELDLFTTIDMGYHTLKEIVAATRCSERGMRILLDALCPLGLLSKSGGNYFLTPTSEAFLVRGKPTYYGDFCLQTQLAWEVRRRVAKGIKTGMAVGIDTSRPDSEDLWAQNMATAILTWPQWAERAREMWETLGVNKETKTGLRILDVACGRGVKSLVLAQADRDVHVTALDFPKVLEVTAKVAEAMGVTKQITLRKGDILTAGLGAEEFDTALFGAILYYFNPKQVVEILGRAHKALKPGGLLVINSYIADEERCKAEEALMVAFQLFLFAPQSEVYTFSEYKGFLEEVGFTNVTQHSDMLISAKK
jgi:ubiquinone/menaquinone biosynthesis C-methylase UbiE